MRINEVALSKTMYHVSRTNNQDSIKNLGLLPSNKEHLNITRTPGVYLFASIDSAIDWAFWSALDTKQSMDIWAVTMPPGYDIKKDTHPEMKDFNAYVGAGNIPSSNLTVVKTQPVPKSTKEAPPLSKSLNLAANV